MSQLADAHITAMQRIRALVEQLVTQAWTGLPAYDEQNVPEFTDLVVPVILAAQRQSAALTDAYIARALERQPLGIPAELVTGAAVRAGTAPADVYRRPFVTIWTALQNGTDWQAAVNAGLERATSTAAMDVQLTMTHTLREIGSRDDRIVGFQRVPDAGACTFCQLVSGQRYRTDQLMPLHNRCGCGVDVITTADRHLFTGNAANDLDLPAGVAVEQHGELGPVLADPAHTFAHV